MKRSCAMGKVWKKGRSKERGRWWSFSCGRTDNSSSAKCSGQTNSQLKFQLHGEHTCINCNTTIVHRRHAQAGVWIGWLGLGYQKIGCLRPTFEDYLRGKRRLVCTVHSTKSYLTRHRYRRITPLSRSIHVLVRGSLLHPYVWVLQNYNSDFRRETRDISYSR